MQQAAGFSQPHSHLPVAAFALVAYGQQAPFPLARHAHRHRNAHRRPVGAVHPRVIRNRVDQAERLQAGAGRAGGRFLRIWQHEPPGMPRPGRHQTSSFHRHPVQRSLHHPPVERLPQAVRGDEPKPSRSARAHQPSRVVPPVHDEVRTLRHVGPGGTQRLHIAVAQRGPHRPGANERRIPHNEIRRRPLGGARVHVAPLRHLRGLVGHIFARHRVLLEGGAVPAGDDLARFIRGQLGAVVGQHRVAIFDVAVVVHDGLGHRLAALCSHVPLKPANP
ncbi:MAG: hypothetical protein BWX79_00668 [Alphaproteobacteria bacterium ADurb.Bin100]|nr:MAG: hypothetical protein BWX79_00668 [Alphaproteobacteria bacterium ADurb.Bin100]